MSTGGADARDGGDGADDVALDTGPLEVRISPTTGGRLATLRYRGVDLVLPRGRVPGFWGDTFWPSPQSLFDWPPPRVLDGDAYEVLAHSARRIVLRSEVDPGLGLQFDKSYSVGVDTLDFSFTVRNAGPVTRSLAPWQVTRAPRVGLVVWAPGEPFRDDDRLAKQREDPGCWYVHDRGTQPFPGLTSRDGLAAIHVPDVPRTCKLFTDARGWQAHVHDATVLLRVFPDLAPAQAAPRQAEVELFFTPERDYIELENQGPHQTLQPGESLHYATQWRLATLPGQVPTHRVTPALVEALESLLGEPLR